MENPYPYAVEVGDSVQLSMLWKHGRFRVEEFVLPQRLTLPAAGATACDVRFVVPQQLAGERFDVGFALRREGYTNWYNGKALPVEVAPLR